MGTIKPGIWDVVVDSTFLGKSRKKGTGYIGVRFKDDVGDTITAYLYTSDAALGRTIETLEMLGWSVEANNGDVNSLNETPLLVGAKAEIVVEDEEYEGKFHAKVKWINPPGGGGGRVEAMTPNEAMAFAAALRAKVYGTRAGKAPSAKPAARPAAKPAPAKTTAPPDDQGGDDSDIPF